jgi:hypothetical protein
MTKLSIDLTCFTSNLTFSKSNDEFVVERQDLGTFNVNEKTYSKPGRRISKEDIFMLTPVASLENKRDGVCCAWHKVIVPTLMLDEPGKLEDVISQLKEKSQSERDRINAIILEMFNERKPKNSDFINSDSGGLSI